MKNWYARLWNGRSRAARAQAAWRGNLSRTWRDAWAASSRPNDWLANSTVPDRLFVAVPPVAQIESRIAAVLLRFLLSLHRCNAIAEIIALRLRIPVFR